MWFIVRHINTKHTQRMTKYERQLLSFPSLPFLPFPSLSRRKGEGGKGKEGGAGLLGRARRLRIIFFFDYQVDGVVSVGQRADRVVEDVTFVVERRQARLLESFGELALGFGSDALHRGFRRDFVEQRRAVGDVQHPWRGSPWDAFCLLLLVAVCLQDGVHLRPQANELSDVLVLHFAEDLFVGNAEGLVRLGIVAGVVIVEVRGHVCVHVRRFQVVDQAVGVGH